MFEDDLDSKFKRLLDNKSSDMNLFSRVFKIKFLEKV